METCAEREMLDRLLQLYRVQRHDFLNHFQVIMGYLQMNKSQAALDYLKQAASEIMAKAPLARLNPPELAVEVMLLEAECFKQDVEFSAAVPEGLPQSTWKNSYGEAFQLIRARVNGIKRLNMEVKQSAVGIEVVINFNLRAQKSLEELYREISALDISAEESWDPDQRRWGLRLRLC